MLDFDGLVSTRPGERGLVVFAGSALLLVALLSLTCFFFARLLGRRVRLGSASAPVERAALLLVTAHPDDEAMFFLPLLSSSTWIHAPGDGESEVQTSQWISKHVLCLSNGDFDGLGRVREKEVSECVGRVSRPTATVQIGEFSDGPKESWDLDEIARVVRKAAENILSDLPRDERAKLHIVTFDEAGVSGHANHVSCHFGVQKVDEMIKTLSYSSKVRSWKLVSDSSTLAKYSGFVGAYLGGGARPSEPVAINDDLHLGWTAMALHVSQFVWYRRLFVLAYRGMFFNRFKPM